MRGDLVVPHNTAHEVGAGGTYGYSFLKGVSLLGREGRCMQGLGLGAAGGRASTVPVLFPC